MLSEFLTDLMLIAPLTGGGTYSFTNRRGERIGFVQIIPESQNQVMVHRLWTLLPRHGHGSVILKELCELADRHGIVLKLKAMPMGAKPYPFSREQLVDWYRRHGFQGRRRKMIREPRFKQLDALAFRTLQISP